MTDHISVGQAGEIYALLELAALGLNVEPGRSYHGVDILVDGCVPVEVKSSRLVCHSSGRRVYEFCLRRWDTAPLQGLCVICVGLTDELDLVDIWVIPAGMLCGYRKITIPASPGCLRPWRSAGRVSKWWRFSRAWDILRAMCQV